MTEEKARSLADSFLAQQGIQHEGYIESRFLCAEKFNRLYGYQKYEEDFWVVEFKKRIRDGVILESPNTIAVMVFAMTERTRMLSSP